MSQSPERVGDVKPVTNRPRILLADGHSDMRQYLTRLLSEHYEIDAAADASTALALAGKRAPDLVVADVMMRASGDLDILREFRRDVWRHVPIILYSTARDEDSVLNASEAGDADVITPFSERRLLAHVRAHLQVVQMRNDSIQSLRLSEERFRTLKTMITPGVWVKAPNGEVISELAGWWEKLTGQTPEQYTGLGYLDVVHPADKPRMLETCQNALRDKTAYQHEFRIRHRNGSYIHVRSQGAPVCDGAGNVREWVGTMINIDESRRAEEELRASEERHRAFMAMTTLAVWTTAPNGDVVADIPGWRELTGQSPDQYRGFGWLETLHPDDKPRVLEDWQHALREGTPVDVEYRVSRKGGTYCYVRDQGVPLRDPDGSVREWVGTVTDIDDQKRTQEALRASEERFRTLITTTSVAVWNASASGEIVGECHGWEEMTGQNPDEYRGWGWTDVLHPDDRPRVLEVYERCLHDRVPIHGEYRSRRRDGSYGYVRSHLAPVFNPDGRVREWIGMIVDIDHERRAEEAQHEIEEEFRANFELAGIGQVQTDPKTGRYLRVNKKFCEMVGYSADELVTMTFLDLTHPEGRADGQAFLLDLLRGEANKISTDKRYVRKDGSIFWGLVTSTLIRDAHGHPLRTITMIEDVTERRQSEAVSQCQKRALEMVAQGRPLEEVLDFIILAVEKEATVDLHGFVLILGEDGKSVSHCAAPSLPESYRNAIALGPASFQDAPRFLAMSEKQPVIVRDLANAPEWADAAALLAAYSVRSIWEMPIIASDQGVLGRFCLHSRQPRAPGATEQTLMENVAHTIALVIERKEAEAERERLLRLEQAAREQAEAANRVKDEFLAVVSHELRAPLNAINGWAYMLLGRKMDEESRARALQSIQRQVQTQCQLIDDLLDVARIASGKLRLELQEVEPSKVIAAALDVVRPAADAKQIDLLADLDHDVGTVSADPARLQQVIWNLLSNAIKFTPEGGHVEIRSRCVGSDIEIIVADTGKGISQDFLPYVFERFRQDDVSSTRTYGGLGLGLAIVRTLVELHGGTVFVESLGAGKGSTFTVRLPIRVVSTNREKIAGQKEEPESRRDSSAGEREILKGLRVLVVDDNAQDREVLLAELAHHGATVSASASAAGVLAELDQFQPDILVADIGMPGEDGYSLIRKIRARPLDRGGLTPAIALTAYAGDTNRKLALDAGYQKHVTKPADPTELAMAIRSLARGDIDTRQKKLPDIIASIQIIGIVGQFLG